MNIRLRWARAARGKKWLLLTGAALVLALAVEGVCNLRAWTTRNLTPVPLSVSDIAVESNVSVEQSEGGVYVENAANRFVDLVCHPQALALRTVQVNLQGEGVVQVSVFLRDEASAFTSEQTYSVTLIAGDQVLSACYAEAESAGAAGEVRVRLNPQDNGLFAVTGITLNARVPFQWQPFRMALVFAASLALLRALFLGGFRTAYDPARLSHRLIVAVPLAGLMVFMLFLAQWIRPDIPLFQGVNDEAAAQGDDVYAVLYEALRSGSLSVPREPDEALLALTNPYDQSERVAKGVNFPFDYAYDNGKYYVYYGVAPVLTVYAPYHALTGRAPGSRDATLIMAWLAVVFVGFAICGLAKRYLPGVSVFALSLGCVTAVFASGAPLLLACADFYYLAELSFVTFCAGSVAFGLHASVQPRRGLRYAQYALSGVCFALTAMSRPGALPMLAAFLAPLFVCELIRRRARIGDAASFLVPALLGAGALMWYNAARFGSVFDFGQAYQMSVADMHWNRVRLMELPQALYHYLLEPLAWNNRFPYLSAGYHASPTAGRYVFTLPCAGMLAFPVVWALALWPLASARFPAETPLLRRERNWTLLLPLLVSLPLMLVSYGLAGAILRYTCDFRLFYALAGVLCAMAMATRANTPEKKALAAVCVLLCAGSLFVGFALLFDNERNYVLRNSPQIYYGLQRMFFPY